MDIDKSGADEEVKEQVVLQQSEEVKAEVEIDGSKDEGETDTVLNSVTESQETEVDNVRQLSETKEESIPQDPSGNNDETNEENNEESVDVPNKEDLPERKSTDHQHADENEDNNQPADGVEDVTENEDSQLPDSMTQDEPSRKESIKITADIPIVQTSDTNPSPDLSRSSPESQIKNIKQASGPPLEITHEGPPPPTPKHPMHRSSKSRASIQLSSSLNQMAITASAQNKLSLSRLHGIVGRLGRHTESSAGKRGRWYKSETNYVDMTSYSWKNIDLYKDYQHHLWTDNGAVKTSCRK